MRHKPQKTISRKLNEISEMKLAKHVMRVFRNHSTTGEIEDLKQAFQAILLDSYEAAKQRERDFQRHMELLDENQLLKKRINRLKK